MGRKLRQERPFAFRRVSEREAREAELFFRDLLGAANPKQPSGGKVSRAASGRRVDSLRAEPQRARLPGSQRPGWRAELYDEAYGLPEDDEEAWQEFDAESVEPHTSPNGANAPFAPLLSGTGYWPIITSDSRGRTVSYRTAADAHSGFRRRSFGANRSNGTRYHVGVDLFGRFGDSVVAIEDGRIVNFFGFCCGENKTSWALLVQHAQVVVNYGEVAPDSLRRNGLTIGSDVRAGQVIGRVGRNPGGSTMIHFETYTRDTTRSYRWLKGRTRPARLLNPTRLLLQLQEQGLPRPAGGGTATTAGGGAATRVGGGASRYGCHDLQRGDRDSDPGDGNRPRWGGQAGANATVCQGAPAPSDPNPRHVRQLQDDLRALGFLVVGNSSGVFNRHTEWAVREFQIYAKMETVARIRAGVGANLRRGAHLVAAELGHDATTNQSAYVASLESVANNARYQGRVSGIVNTGTRAALDHWLTNNWRCPVVIEAWTMRRGTRHRPAAINLWAHDSHSSNAPRMFARDFTGYYTMPPGRNANDMQVIGDFTSFSRWSGPRSVPPRHTWAEGELLPAALVGNAAPAGATLSTYRVVRAVSEVECIGFFDSVNSYDNAFVSIGPCHWTLGIVSRAGAFSEGELCGYLAYLRHIDNAAFVAAIEFFGVRIDENWVSAAGPADGADLFSRGSRKYTGWVAMEQENGSFARLPQNEADGNYFKTWHWFYRFVMAGRTITGYRQRMWDMARVRLRDILGVPWGAGVSQVGAGTPAARAARIGDLFTSERAVGMLLRWHIRFPAHVISGGAPGQRLRNALTRAQAAAAGLHWAGDPRAWTDAHEGRLINGILAAAPANVQRSLQYVRDWPNWLGGANPRGFALAAPVAARLNDARGSFDMDDAGLPPAPP